MKTYNNLFSKICTYDNFYKAYKNAIKGKEHYTDVKSIKRYGVHKYLTKLLNEVVNKEYKVSKYKVFEKFTGHKVREIYKLPMRDRIVQHAIMLYLEPIFRENFILDTYSSIKCRGIHLALSRVKKALKDKTHNYKYCLQLDINKCYPSLDQNILKHKLAKKFKDKDLLWLLFTIIDSCDKGVPIGNYTSQYFNNFYFTEFDHWIKEVKHIKPYFRYCDDMIILGETKEELHNIFEEIKIEINKLNVKLKDSHRIFPINEGISFVGYIIRKDYILIRKTTKINFINKVIKMNFDNFSRKDINVLGSYWGIFVHSDCRNLWFKYTGVKTFKELKIKVHNRDFVKDIIGIKLIITRSVVYQKRGVDWLKFECDYDTTDKNGNVVKHEEVIVGTSAEKLVEAGKQFNADCYPFETTIVIDNKGFYNFS